jgi:putative Mg2+ transporter-C (MgtC) family protein
MTDLDFMMLTIQRLGLAFFLGGFIGYERERAGHGAGLRTHILVCLGGCLLVLIDGYVREFIVGSGAHDPTRVMAGVIAGIGFLGGGAIIKNQDRAVGLTTAATVWMSAAIGLAVGIGFWFGAMVSTGMVLLTLTCLQCSKKGGV